MSRADWIAIVGILLTVWANVIATLTYIRTKEKPQPKRRAKHKRKR